jgi:hypothetical protein
MAEHMRMIDSLNARLDTLVSRMNRATGNQKVTTMADVINELVGQRKVMHQHMREMMESRQGTRTHMMGNPAPAGGRRTVPPVKDSAAEDTSHAAHHPPD